MVGVMGVSFSLSVALLLPDFIDDVAASETEALFLAVVGMGVVFSALVTIGVCIYLLGLIFADRPKAEPEEVAAPLAVSGTDVDSRTIAILTAAAYAAVGQPVSVQRITFINRNTISAWAERGRVSIHGSHNVRRTL